VLCIKTHTRLRVVLVFRGVLGKIATSTYLTERCANETCTDEISELTPPKTATKVATAW